MTCIALIFLPFRFGSVLKHFTNTTFDLCSVNWLLKQRLWHWSGCFKIICLVWTTCKMFPVQRGTGKLRKKEKLIIGYKQNILQFPNLIRLDKIIDLFLNSIQKINGSYNDHFYIVIWNATFCIIITMASLDIRGTV